MKRVVDGGYLSWIFGSDPRRINIWNKSVVVEFSRWLNTVIIMEGGDLDRKKYFPEYKAHRHKSEKTDPAKTARRIRVKKFAEDMETDRKLETIKFPGLEADDVLAAFAVLHGQRQQTHHRIPMSVFGIDKDYLQLGQLVDIRKTSNEVVDFDGWLVRQQKTLQPVLSEAWHILLILALMGDSSDNVPRLIPPRQLQIVFDILKDTNPWIAAHKLYEEAFITNLYLTVLPGAWCYDPIPTPDQTLTILANGGLKEWYAQPFRKDIIKSYEIHFEGKHRIQGENKK